MGDACEWYKPVREKETKQRKRWKERRVPNNGWEYNIVQFAEWERKQGTRDGSRQNILQENQAGWGMLGR